MIRLHLKCNLFSCTKMKRNRFMHNTTNCNNAEESVFKVSHHKLLLRRTRQTPQFSRIVPPPLCQEWPTTIPIATNQYRDSNPQVEVPLSLQILIQHKLSHDSKAVVIDGELLPVGSGCAASETIGYRWRSRYITNAPLPKQLNAKGYYQSEHYPRHLVPQVVPHHLLTHQICRRMPCFAFASLLHPPKHYTIDNLVSS